MTKPILLNVLGLLALFSALDPAVVAQVLTFANPSPTQDNEFGISVAAVGPDRVLIGAWHANNAGAHRSPGAAYLFHTNGALLTAFTNPAPAPKDWAVGWFGASGTAMGTDRVLIGAPGNEAGAWQAGVAYLFSTDGALLTTFTNPAPAITNNFGSSVAAVGTDRVLIGTPGDDTGAKDTGAAYLFDTNGVLLTTLTNPAPADYDHFGSCVSVMATDRVLIGAPGDGGSAGGGGAAYLFSTDGTLLTKFTNPLPAGHHGFGSAVAALGSDRVLIGDGAYAGAAYAFSTDGKLLTTFRNPAPGDYDHFGSSLAVTGADGVLIGAPGHAAGADSYGVVYAFNTNATLIATLSNPATVSGREFGHAVAALGGDCVLVGSPGNSTGAQGYGVAYLFGLEPLPPQESLLSASGDARTWTFVVSWPAPADGWLLEWTNALPSASSSSWPQVPVPYQTNAGKISVTLTNYPGTGDRFFRLHKP